MDSQHINPAAMPAVPANKNQAEEQQQTKAPVPNITKLDALSINNEMFLDLSDGTNTHVEDKDAQSSDGSYISRM